MATTGRGAHADRSQQRDEREIPRTVTLLKLVSELSAGAGECEVVATVMALVEQRRVRLIGQVREDDVRAASRPFAT